MKSNAKKQDRSPATPAAPSAIELLTEEHTRVKSIFRQFENVKEGGGSKEKKAALVREACDALTIHALIEEEIFYPAVRRATGDADTMDEADVEHDCAKDLIAQLRGMGPDDDHFDAKFIVLAEMVRHHIKEEESVMFPEARNSSVNLDALGRRMFLRRQELEREAGLADEATLAVMMDIETRTGTQVI